MGPTSTGEPWSIKSRTEGMSPCAGACVECQWCAAGVWLGLASGLEHLGTRPVEF